MKIDTRKLWIARFLLVVYLSILSASVFHVHGGETIVCHNCVNHVQHSGHITIADVSLDDCILCYFLSTSYLAAVVIVLAAMAHVLRRDFVEQTACIVCRTKRAILLRGPPVCL